jgi:hypothetical protein
VPTAAAASRHDDSGGELHVECPRARTECHEVSWYGGELCRRGRRRHVRDLQTSEAIAEVGDLGSDAVSERRHGAHGDLKQGTWRR